MQTKDKLCAAAISALFIIFAAYPAAVLVGRWYFGVKVSLYFPMICAAGLLGLAAAGAVICAKCSPELTIKFKVLAAALPTLAVINWALFFELAYELEMIPCALLFLMLFACVVIAFIILLGAVKEKAVRAFGLIVPGLAILPLLLFSFIAVFFGTMGALTTVEREYSPDMTKYAEIIDSDQGATGGSTLVYAYRNVEGSFLVFRWEDIPQEVYSGRWGEFNDMKMEWKDNTTLVINGREYRVR